ATNQNIRSVASTIRTRTRHRIRPQPQSYRNGERNFRPSLKSDGRNREVRLFTKISLTLACVIFVVAESQAQTNRKNELGLLLGATVTPELETTSSTPAKLEIGSGITFQLTYARQLTTGRKKSLYLEVPALAVPLQDIKAPLGSVPRNYDSFFVTPALRLKLVPNHSVSPWV